MNDEGATMIPEPVTVLCAERGAALGIKSDFEEALAVFYVELSSKQHPLGKECEKVLSDNLWDLLVTP